MPTPYEGYWDVRSGLVYYYYVATLVAALASDADSILDVGARNTPVLEWFPWIKTREALDRVTPYSSENVIGIKEDFLTFSPTKRYDFCLCLQVLEHVPDVSQFAQKLFSVSKRVLISVPYLWPEGASKGHIHDPIDEEKLYHWTKRKPSYSVIVAEPLRIKKSHRLISYYHDPEEPFSLHQRRNNMRQIPREAQLLQQMS